VSWSSESGNAGREDERRPGSGLIERVERIAGIRPVAWSAVTGRGFTPAERWVVRFQDGSSAFAKVATERLTVNWIRLEHLVTRTLKGRSCQGSSAGMTATNVRCCCRRT
jgi:hypothetical protein